MRHYVDFDEQAVTDDVFEAMNGVMGAGKYPDRWDRRGTNRNLSELILDPLE
jgi:hypothetical protein